jgi:hypothetical protein
MPSELQPARTRQQLQAQLRHFLPALRRRLHALAIIVVVPTVHYFKERARNHLRARYFNLAIATNKQTNK